VCENLTAGLDLEQTLFIANADNNLVAVFDVSTPGKSRSLGFIPVGWYPTSVRITPDGKELLATAWEPYQELFQGVIVCLHSDFRIGGLKPGESKKIRGKIYFLSADVDLLLKRYAADFPEQAKQDPNRKSD